MKKTLFTFAALITACLAFTGMASAFHSGGVADCAGCHTMHGGSYVASTSKTPGVTGPYLLQGSDQSSTCLNCHNGTGGPGIFTSTATPQSGTAPLVYSPGGDFGWLLGTGYSTTYPATHRGHQIIAADYVSGTFGTNGGWTTVPGDTSGFNLNSFYCNSCHDPHPTVRRVDASFNYVAPGATGNTEITNGVTMVTSTSPIVTSGSSVLSGSSTTYGSDAVTPLSGFALGVYRILANSSNYHAAGQPISFPGVPVALAAGTSVSSEATSQMRVAYANPTGNGATTISLWCATCHKSYYKTTSSAQGTTQATAGEMHPTDYSLSATANIITGMTEAANYNAYVGTGVMTATATNSYNSLVPFASTASSFETLSPLASVGTAVTGTYAYGGNAGQGPQSGDTVVCLSCHRAHASAWQHMLRWNNEYQFITQNGWPTSLTSSATLGYATNVITAAYYGRTANTTTTTGTVSATNFGVYQRSLCNKCHAWD